MSKLNHYATLHLIFSRIWMSKQYILALLNKVKYQCRYTQTEKSDAASGTVYFMIASNNQKVIEGKTPITYLILAFISCIWLMKSSLQQWNKCEHDQQPATKIQNYQKRHIWNMLQSTKALDWVHTAHLSLSPLLFWSKFIKHREHIPTNYNSNHTSK